jgi:hypothetical protein
MRTVIIIECLHQAINISASNKTPLYFKELNYIFMPFTTHRNSDIVFQKVPLLQC